MVGAPTSTGCHTCRRRKIKCGEQRPECDQCRKRGLTCGGYIRDTVFLNASSPDGATSRPSWTAAYRDYLRDRTPKLSLEKAVSRAGRRAYTSQAKSSLIAATIDDRDNVKANLFQAFLELYLPVGEGKAPRRRSLVCWFLIVPDLLPPSDLLSRTLVALSMARLSRVKDDHRTAMEARVLFGSALQKLQATLNDKRLVYRDETLAACHACTIFEILEPNGSSLAGWLAHVNGIAKLVQLRGPSLHRSPAAHQIFLGCRGTAILAALATRKRTFLAEPEWKTVPWEIVPKTIQHHLFDAIVDVPEIQEEFDLLETLAHSDDAFQCRVRLIQRAWAVDSAIDKWSDLARQESNSSRYWPELSLVENPADDPQLGKVFPIAYRFSNVQTAQMYLYYWASKILLYRTLRLTYKALREQVGICIRVKTHSIADSDGISYPRSHVPNTEAATDDDRYGNPFFDLTFLPPCPGTSKLWESACNIAQSIEYCMSDEMRLLGSQIVMMPLRCAIEVFIRHPGRELEWSRATFASLNGRRGLPITRRICSVQWRNGQPIQPLEE